MKLFVGNELIFRFMFINISSGTAVGMMNFIIPVYALSLNASYTEIGLIRGISGVGELLVVLPAGFLVDYFGSKKIASNTLGAHVEYVTREYLKQNELTNVDRLDDGRWQTQTWIDQRMSLTRIIRSEVNI